MFIHYDSIPEKLEDYKWNSTMKGDNRLMISPLERENARGNLENEKFYITIRH